MQEQRNLFFTGREHIFADIASFFADDHLNMPIALCGIGGIGKTQIALEYAYRHQEQYQTVIWLDASTHLVLSVEIGVFADQHIDLTDAERTNEPQLFAAVKDWLQRQDRWLLVLDHIEDLTLIEEVVPSQYKQAGHVLLTTQQQSTGTLAYALPIAPMSTEEGALFLLRRAELLPLAVPLTQAPVELVHEASIIVKRVDGFPLALDQVGGYVKETKSTLTDYLALYDQVGQRRQVVDDLNLLKEAIGQSVKRLSSRTLALMHLLSLFSPDIPEILLIDGASELSKPLRSLTDLDLTQMIAELLDFSLVDRHEGILHLHSIVQAVIIQSLSTKQQSRWANQVVRLVNRAFPEVRFDTHAECERYLPQAEHGATLITRFHLTLKEGGLLLERLGNYRFRQAAYGKAETYLTQARDLYEHYLSSEVLNRAQMLNTLGLLYSELARYQEAEACHLHALELREHLLGPDNLITAQSLHNLAVIYGYQGKYQEAEHIYLRVLTIEKTTDDNSDSTETLNNLGLTYYEMGHYAKAEEYYQRALTTYEQEKGPEHPDLASTLTGLGRLAEEQEDYQRAEVFYQRALTIRAQTLAPDHPEIAYSLNHLADIYESLGKYQQAEEFYRRALTIIDHVLGPAHPDVALLLNNLAFLTDSQGFYEQAEPLYQRALSIYEHALGAQHPHVASVIHNLGQLYQSTGDIERAESFLHRALVLREQMLGPSHPNVFQSLSALGGLLADQQRDGEAELLLQRALTLHPRVFGLDHSSSKRLREKYQSLVERRKKVDER